jgi:hypothetical protein
MTTTLMRQLKQLKERYGADDFTVEELADDDPILRAVDEGKDASIVGSPDPLIVGRAADNLEGDERQATA